MSSGKGRRCELTTTAKRSNPAAGLLASPKHEGKPQGSVEGKAWDFKKGKEEMSVSMGKVRKRP